LEEEGTNRRNIRGISASAAEVGVLVESLPFTMTMMTTAAAVMAAAGVVVHTSKAVLLRPERCCPLQGPSSWTTTTTSGIKLELWKGE
jgi:hypothetical protein